MPIYTRPTVPSVRPLTPPEGQPQLPPPVQPDEWFPGYQQELTKLGKETYRAQKRKQAAQPTALSQLMVGLRNKPLANWWSAENLLATPYLSSAEAIKKQVDERRAELDAADALLERTSWRANVLSGLPLTIMSRKEGARTVEEALAKYPSTYIIDEDKQWLATTFEKLKHLQLPELPEAMKSMSVTEAKKYLYDVILKPERLPMADINSLTVDELVKYFQPGNIKLPEGMTTKDMYDLMTELDPDSELISEEDKKALDDIDALAKKSQEQWALQAQYMNLIRAGMIMPETTALTPMEFFKLAATSPMAATSDILNKYFHMLSNPLQAYFYMGVASAAGNIFNRPLDPESPSEKIRAIYNEYLELGENPWEAAALALEESDIHGLLKFMTSVAIEPMNLLGWGLGAKLGMKFFGPAGKALFGGLDNAALDIIAAPVMLPLRGLKYAGKAAWTGLKKVSPQTARNLSELTRSLTLRSRVTSQSALMELYASLGRRLPERNGTYTAQDITDTINAVVKAARTNPTELSQDVRAGRKLLIFDYIKADDIKTWLTDIGFKKVDIDVPRAALVNVELERLLSGQVPKETAGNILSKLALAESNDSVNALASKLTKWADRLADGITDYARGDVAKGKLKNLYTNIEELTYRNFHTDVYRHAAQAGRATSWLARGVDNILYHSWLTSMERRFVSPIANQYLLFTNYGPYNYAENAMRSFLNGGDLLVPVGFAGTSELNAATRGLSNAYYDSVMYEREAARLDMAIVDPKTGETMIKGTGVIPFITKDSISLGGKTYKIPSLEKFKDWWGEQTTKQRDWDRLRTFMESLHEVAPAEMQMLEDAIVKRGVDLDSIKFFDIQDARDMERVILENIVGGGPEALTKYSKLSVMDWQQRQIARQANKTLDKATEVQRVIKNGIRNDILDGTMFSEGIDKKMAAYVEAERELTVVSLANESSRIQKQADEFVKDYATTAMPKSLVPDTPGVTYTMTAREAGVHKANERHMSAFRGKEEIGEISWWIVPEGVNVSFVGSVEERKGIGTKLYFEGPWKEAKKLNKHLISFPSERYPPGESLFQKWKKAGLIDIVEKKSILNPTTNKIDKAVIYDLVEAVPGAKAIAPEDFYADLQLISNLVDATGEKTHSARSTTQLRGSKLFPGEKDKFYKASDELLANYMGVSADSLDKMLDALRAKASATVSVTPQAELARYPKTITDRVVKVVPVSSHKDVSIDRHTGVLRLVVSDTETLPSQIAHELAHVHYTEPGIRDAFTKHMKGQIHPERADELYAEAFEEFVTSKPMGLIPELEAKRAKMPRQLINDAMKFIKNENLGITPTQVGGIVGLSKKAIADFDSVSAIMRLKNEALRATRAQDRQVTNAYIAAHPGKRSATFWDDLEVERNKVWAPYEKRADELKELGLEADARFLTGIGKSVYLPKYVPPVTKDLTPNHLAYLLGTTGVDLNRALFKLDTVITIQPKSKFNAYVMNRARAYARSIDKTAEDIGFTKQAVDDVYDQLFRNLGLDPKKLTPDTPSVLQLEDIRQELHRLHSAVKMSNEDYVKWQGYVNGLKEDVKNLPIYGKALPDYDIGLGERVATPKEVEGLGEIGKGPYIISEPIGYLDKIRTELTAAAEAVPVVRPSRVKGAPEVKVNLRYEIDYWFLESDNAALQTIGRTASQAPEYLAKVRAILTEKYPSGYIRIYRGSGKAKGQFADREFTNVTSSRKTALDFEDTWGKQVPVSELFPAGTKFGPKEIKPSLDNVLIKVDDIVSIAAVEESELIIPTAILKDRISNPLKAPAVVKDKWWSLKEQAMSKSREKHEFAYPTYDIEGQNIIDETMRQLFPFWTYETFRWKWLPKTLLSKPGIATGLARYMDYTDDGYIPVPGTDLQFNLLRGTIFMGGLRRLYMKDFPEFYDAFPGAGLIDAIGRYGFYPGIHILGPLALLGTMQGKPELGELAPAWVRTILSAARAIAPEPVGKLLDIIYPDRFRDYQTMLELGSMGYDADAIWSKKKQQIKLTPEEESLWLAATNKANGMKGILMEQTGLFRIKPAEYIQMRKSMREAITQMTGVPETIQDEIDRRYPVTGKRFSDYYKLDILQTKMLYMNEAYRRWQGVTTPLYPSGWQMLDVKITDYYESVEKLYEDSRRTGVYADGQLLHPSIVQLNKDLVAGKMSPSQWSTQVADTKSRLSEAARVLGESPAYVDVPKTLEERAKYLESRGVTTPTYGPDQELLYAYYDIKPEYRFNWESNKMELDFDTYYAKIDHLLDALDGPYKQRLLDRIQIEWTPLERLYWDVSRKYLRPYRVARNLVLEQYDPDQVEAIRRYEVARGAERDEIRAMVGPDGEKLVSHFTSEVKEIRDRMRRLDPELDAWLYFFGITDISLTRKSAQIYKDLASKYLTAEMTE